MLPSSSTPRPRAGSHPASVRGRGTNPALFSPLRPPGRDEVTGPGIKPGFLGPGHWGRAGPGARSGMLAGHPCSRTPKPSQVFLNSSYQFRAISGHCSQPCCQQLKIFWEGGTETRGKAARDGRRKKIRGRTRGGGRERVRSRPCFHCSHARMPPEKASRCHHLLTFPQSGARPRVALVLVSECRNRGSDAHPKDRVWGPKAEHWGFQQSPSPWCLGSVHRVGFLPSPGGC